MSRMAFHQHAKSITYVSSTAPNGPNPTLTPAFSDLGRIRWPNKGNRAGSGVAVPIYLLLFSRMFLTVVRESCRDDTDRLIATFRMIDPLNPVRPACSDPSILTR